ncbi:hypothetical protein TWF694_008011 [Orbilia ellipsospora]|uniref:Extracellular membrane protein CFEM domain-containing protein n=1 Tax=Orbilia ellipsospora TaxID=2528407 RepID=A0AAV9XF91_9PEZI
MSSQSMLDPRRRITIFIYHSLLLLLPALLTTAQLTRDPNAASCQYIEDAFSICWRRRHKISYTAPAVAQCVCTVGGTPDLQINSAVPSCVSYLQSIGQEDRGTAIYSSFNGYCSSYGQARTETGGTAPTALAWGRENCEAILGVYNVCQRSPEDLITEPEVASCICHDRQGFFNTVFDGILPPCYKWAKDFEPEFASEISSLFGFCTRYGTYTFQKHSTPRPPKYASITSTTVSDGATITSSPSQAENSASAACDTFARIANACRTGPLDPLTRPAVANCICSDPSNGGYGTAFDDILMNCVPYAMLESPEAGSEIESLSGYCTIYADGAKTNTLTSTSTSSLNKANSTHTVTDEIFVSTTGLPVETSPARGGSDRYQADAMSTLILVALISALSMIV